MSVPHVVELVPYSSHLRTFATTLPTIIYYRGPIKAAINANPLRNYTGGILGSDDDPAMLDTHHNHGVSIVGWGYDEERKTQHWIVRNSWGVYWVSVENAPIISCMVHIC